MIRFYCVGIGFILVACLEPRVDDMLHSEHAGDCTTCHNQPSDEVHESCEGCHGDAAHLGPHDIHLEGGGEYSLVFMECDTCHVIPEHWFDGNHLDGITDVAFSDLNELLGVDSGAVWEEGRCKNIYCHGVTLSGGENTEPVWGEDQSACGDCHSLPPSEDHPRNSGCSGCHAPVYRDGERDKKHHINGVIDIDDDALTDEEWDTDVDPYPHLACGVCHEFMLAPKHQPVEQFPIGAVYCHVCHFSSGNGAKLLNENLPCWKNPGCLTEGCHRVPNIPPHQNIEDPAPYKCGFCHGFNGAPRFPLEKHPSADAGPAEFQ